MPGRGWGAVDRRVTWEPHAGFRRQGSYGTGLTRVVRRNLTGISSLLKDRARQPVLRRPKRAAAVSRLYQQRS